MELRDITNIDELLAQLKIDGIIIEDLADRLQDLKKIEVVKQHTDDEIGKSLDEAQELLYQASRKLGEVTDA